MARTKTNRLPIVSAVAVALPAITVCGIVNPMDSLRFCVSGAPLDGVDGLANAAPAPCGQSFGKANGGGLPAFCRQAFRGRMEYPTSDASGAD